MEYLSENKLSNGYYVSLHKRKYEKEITIEEYKKLLFEPFPEGESVDREYFIAAYYYFTEKNILQALDAIERAIDILESRGKRIIDGLLDEVPKYRIYSAAGQFYADIGNIKKSQEYYNKSMYDMIHLKPPVEADATVYSFRSAGIYSYFDLIDKTITVVHPQKMNDPFDSLFMLWASAENLQSRCVNKNHIPTFCKSFQYFKIRSFVGNKDMISDDSIVQKVRMWSHYADNHAGYCIKYKLSANMVKKRDRSDSSHWFLLPITYLKEGENIDLINDNMNTTKLLATKTAEWKSEEEVRLIYYDTSCEEDFKQISLDEDSRIEAIYFGYKCSVANMRRIMKVLGENVRYYKMKHNFSSIYKFDIEDINYNIKTEEWEQ